VTENEKIEALGAEVAEALAPTERRLEVEHMQQTNDAALVRLAQLHKIGIPREEILGVRLQVLVEQLFGDMDDARRLDYEHAVQTRFAEVIAGVESQATRATLLNGVRLDPKQLPPNGGRG
jgi:hypothetical protein